MSGFSSHSLASVGGGFLTVMIFGQIFAYSVFSAVIAFAFFQRRNRACKRAIAPRG